MSLPMGLGNGLPTGFQIMAPAKHDDMMYKPAAALEAAFAKEAGEASELPTSKWADQAAQNADVSSAEADKINQAEKAEAVDAALKAFPGVRVTKAEEK